MTVFVKLRLIDCVLAGSRRSAIAFSVWVAARRGQGAEPIRFC